MIQDKLLSKASHPLPLFPTGGPPAASTRTAGLSESMITIAARLNWSERTWWQASAEKYPRPHNTEPGLVRCREACCSDRPMPSPAGYRVLHRRTRYLSRHSSGQRQFAKLLGQYMHFRQVATALQLGASHESVVVYGKVAQKSQSPSSLRFKGETKSGRVCVSSQAN